MNLNVHRVRLNNDYKRVRELVDSSDLIHLDATDGNPPERYKIRYSCTGVKAIQPNGQPILTDNHAVSIYLHAEYPTKQPQLKWLTEVFHPNIHVTGAVCIGAWWAAKTLDQLLLTLGEMVQYKNFDPEDPMNSKAAVWATRNRRLFPIDSRPLKGRSLANQIVLGEAEDADDLDIKLF